MVGNHSRPLKRYRDDLIQTMKTNLGKSIGFYTCWMATCAMAAFIPVALLWEAWAHRSEFMRGIDDDFTLLMLPAGIVFGIYAARRTRRKRWLHLACLPVGAVVCILGLYQASVMFASAKRLTGTGPFAGLGESLAGALFVVIAFTGLCVVGIGAFGSLIRRAESAAITANGSAG